MQSIKKAERVLEVHPKWKSLLLNLALAVLSAGVGYVVACCIHKAVTGKSLFTSKNGICERFHKTILNEFYQVTFRKKIYEDLETLQKDLDDWLDYYNNERTHQGKKCCGRTPMTTLIDGKEVWETVNNSVFPLVYI